MAITQALLARAIDWLRPLRQEAVHSREIDDSENRRHTV